MIHVQEVVRRLAVEAGVAPQVRVDRALDDKRRAASRRAAERLPGAARSSDRRSACGPQTPTQTSGPEWPGRTRAQGQPHERLYPRRRPAGSGSQWPRRRSRGTEAKTSQSLSRSIDSITQSPITITNHQSRSSMPAQPTRADGVRVAVVVEQHARRRGRAIHHDEGKARPGQDARARGVAERRAPLLAGPGPCPRRIPPAGSAAPARTRLNPFS